jgi:Asp-tRNA(Asn)/Glu-tRNA(Gln) amidotransferase A subunit family amidase
MRSALAGTTFAALPVPAARTLRLGVCRTHEWDAADAGGRAAFERAVGRAAAAGTRLRDVELPAAAADLFEAQKTVMAYEAVRQLETEWRDHRAQLSAPLIALLDGGRSIADATYRQALDRAADGRRVVADSMRDLDALITPAAVGEAPLGLESTGDPVFSRVWTLLGVPCVGVPGLLGPQGLPIGVQLVGHPHRERDLLALGGTLHAVWRDDGSAAARSTGAR